MYRLLSKSAHTVVRSNRFFSRLNTDELSRLCQMPRIKEAMQKEKITREQILSVQSQQDASRSKFHSTDPNFYYLRQFEERPTLYELYRNGHLSFADYVFAPMDKQNAILLFSEQCKNASEVLSNKYIDLNHHVDSLYWPMFDLFNHKFCQYMLDTRNISLDMYINGNQLHTFYALSEFFLKANFEPYIKHGALSIDRLISLDKEAIVDLTELLKEADWNLQHWLDQNFLTINQFLQCSTEDRKRYMIFMYYSKTPCKNFTLDYFLLFKESTRKYFRFDQNYITPEAFDKLETKLQESLNKSLFSNIGCYALNNKYITIEQYCSLSLKARNALSILFKETDPIYWGEANAQKDTDYIFSNGFDLEQFNELAEQSEADARDFIWDARKSSRSRFSR